MTLSAPSFRHALLYSGKILSLAGAYYAFAVLGLALDPVNHFATLVWAPSGIALAALIVFGPALWPGVFLGAFFAYVLNDAPFFAAGGIGIGNSLEALAGAYLLGRVQFRGTLDRLFDAQNFILVIPISAAIAATIGPVGLWLSGVVDLASLGAAWRTWWLGDALGMLIAAPFLLTRGERRVQRRPLSAHYFFEIGVLIILLAAALFVVFLRELTSFAYILLLPVLWAALRLGQRTATAAILAFAVYAIAYTAIGGGSAVKDALSASPLSLQLFMAVVGGVSLLIAALADEQRQSVRELKKSQHELADFVNNAAIGITWIGLDGTIEWANEAALDLLDKPRAGYIGNHIRSFFVDQTACTDMLRRLSDDEEIVDRETRMRCAKGIVRHIRISANTFKDDAGHIRARLFMVDVTDKKRQEEIKTFLADVSIALTNTKKAELRLDALTRLLVPHLADWCVIDLLEEGKLVRKAVAYARGGRTELVEEFAKTYPLSHSGAHGPAHALREGKTGWYPSLTDELIASAIAHEPYRRTLLKLKPASMLIVPLAAREKKIGVMTLMHAESERHYTADDRSLAEEIAWRTAAAIDNARLLEESERANRAKDDFLSQMSHELRNPLAPMLSALELVDQHEAKNAALTEPLNILKRQTLHISQLLNDLFDISLIARRKISLKQEWVEVRGIVQRAIEIVRPYINSREHGFFVSVPEKPLWMVTDPLRLEEIIVNLLNNAAKYTERGGQIWVHCTQEGDDVALKVRDTGIGIPGEAMPKIFAPFTKFDQPGLRPKEGLGIGLSLVKAFAELQGGRVTVQSEVGRGSEFAVTLPRIPERTAEDLKAPLQREPATAEPAPPKPAPEPQQVKQKKQSPHGQILLVDDNKDGIAVLSLLLERLSWNVRTASSGADAIAAFRECRPDVVILDIGLPDMNGYEVARVLKQSDHTSFLLVALTGYGQKEDEQFSADAGFDHHLTKPVSIAALQSIIAKAGARKTK